jgi:uncharacterized membrane protein YphA (DoxX/SURF4 family)
MIFSEKTLWGNSVCLLRIWCGVIFIEYGSSLLHTDAIYDFSTTLKSVNIPLPLLGAYLCKSTEFFGGILFILGFLIRPVCIFLMVDMIVATFVFHHGHVLDNGITTFLLLLCLIDIFSNKADLFTLDNLISHKLIDHE